MIKGYIFDLDGTLVDSMGMFCRLDRELFYAIGLTPTKEALDTMRYIPTSKTAAYIKEHFSIHYTLEEINDILIKTTIEGYRTVSLKEGVLDYLAFCKKQGIKTGIATATETPIAHTVAGNMAFDVYIDNVVSCTDVDATKAKPDVFLETARRMGLSPSECAVFEDGIPGATSAAEAGFTVVGVYDATAGEEDSAALEAISHRYIRSFCDIKNTLI